MPTTCTNVLKSPCVSNEVGTRLLQGLSRRDRQACDGDLEGIRVAAPLVPRNQTQASVFRLTHGKGGLFFFSAPTLGGSRSACQCGRNPVRCLNVGFMHETERARPCQVERGPGTLGPPFPSGWEAPRLVRVGHRPSALSFKP